MEAPYFLSFFVRTGCRDSGDEYVLFQWIHPDRIYK